MTVSRPKTKREQYWIESTVMAIVSSACMADGSHLWGGFFLLLSLVFTIVGATTDA